MRMGVTKAIVVGTLFAALIRASGQTYTLRELNLPGTTFTSFSRIAPDGTISTTCETTSGFLGFIWRNGQVRTYEGIPGLETFARGSRGPDLVVGSAVSNAGYRVAAVWRNGSYTDLGSLNRSSYAQVVDPSDHIGGSTETHDIQNGMGGPEFEFHPFIYQNGSMLDLGGPRGQKLIGTISSINSVGQAVGFYYSPYDDPGYDSFIWSESTGKQYINGPHNWAAIGKNDAGQIIGNQYINTAILRQPDGTFVNFGAGTAFGGINNQGDIVGAVNNSAVIWRNGGPPVALDTLIAGGGVHVNFAGGINDAGQILGQVFNVGTGTSRSVLLNPVPECSPLLPLATLLCLTAKSLRTRRFRRHPVEGM